MSRGETSVSRVSRSLSLSEITLARIGISIVKYEETISLYRTADMKQESL